MWLSVWGRRVCYCSNKLYAQEAYAVAERIRKDIESTHFIYHADTTLHVTISFGLSQIMSNDTSLEEVVTRADKKLYQSKTNGRNRTSY